jgi:hypothetical protein
MFFKPAKMVQLKISVALPFQFAFVSAMFLCCNVQCLEECREVVKQRSYYAKFAFLAFVFITEIMKL